jgi:hypothetical protein
MKRILEKTEYTFNAGSSEIDFSGIITSGSFEPQYILGVINLDWNRGTLIYNPAGGTALGGVWSSSILTLQYDTASMNNTDNLLIIFDDFTYSQTVNGIVDANTLISSVEDSKSGMSALNINLLTNTTNSISMLKQNQLIMQVNTVGAITSGQFVIEGSVDNVTFVSAPYCLLDEPLFQGVAGNQNVTLNYRNSPINVQASKTYMIMIPGVYKHLRARISSAIVGGTLSCSLMYREGNIQACQPILGTDRAFIALSRTAVGENLLNIINSDLVEVSGYNKFSMRVLGSAGITAGAITIEESNDGAVWTIPTFYNNAVSVFSSARTIAASTEYYFQGPLSMRYFRVRISTAFTGGNVSMWCNLKQAAGADKSYVFGSETLSGVSLYNVGTTDASSAAITSTTTTSPSSFNYQSSGSFSVQVTAVSGTNPTLDVSVEGNMSSLGTSAWFKIYDFPRITSTGTFHSPAINYSWVNQIRYVQTVGGTTPSFTRQISRRLIGNSQGQYLRSFIDRTINPNTLNSTTPSYFVDGMPNFNLIVALAAGGTPGAIQMEGSDNNIDWFSVGTATSLVAGGVVNIHPNQLHMVRWIRARVSTAGTGTTLSYLTIRCTGG